MAAGTTKVQAANLRRKYKNELQNLALVNDTMNALKLKILGTFDKGYLILFLHCTLSYTNIIPLQIITYLNNTCSKIASKDSITLKIQLNKQHVTTITLKDYFNKIEYMQEISGNESIPISHAELLTTAAINVKSTET